jgi:hypothetical protein
MTLLGPWTSNAFRRIIDPSSSSSVQSTEMLRFLRQQANDPVQHAATKPAPTGLCTAAHPRRTVHGHHRARAANIQIP